MKTDQKIAAVIITYNEENNICDCIKSVIDIVDEVIVVDANSTDKTAYISKDLGAKVLTKDWTSYGIQKNHGAEAAGAKWILSIDADERVDGNLNKALLNINLQSDIIYALNVKTNYLGKWIRYCGWYPSYKKRLYQKDMAKWNDELVHEQLISTSKLEIVNLSGNLLHYSYPSLERHHQKIHNYAKLTAQKWKLQGKRPSLLKKLFGPSFRFVKTYIFRLGILDGKEGFLISKMSLLLVKEQLNYFKQLEQDE